MRRRVWALALLMAAAGPVTAAQAPEKVRITVSRANVRSEPSEKAPVIAQVTRGTELECRGEDGGWFQVRLPFDPRLGGVRVEAYVSKKVAAAVKGG